MSKESPGLPLDLPSLPNGWQWCPLDALVDPDRSISYGVVQPGEYEPEGVPIIRVNNIRDGRLWLDDVKRISLNIEQSHVRTRLRGGELLLTLVGSIGECAVAPIDVAGWNIARAVGCIPVAHEIDSKWIDYCLRLPSIQNYMVTWANTTVQVTLNLRDVARLPIPMPPEKERIRITRILGALDDKIDLNRRMNATLEATARALFQSWFVDFDPVRAKAEGRQPEGMDSETAALFPDAFEDSALGLIPKGWRVEPLDKIAEYQNGLALQKFPPEGDEFLPVIKIRELRQGYVDENSDKASPNIKEACIVYDGDVLFSWSGSLLVDVWCGGMGALNQHLFKVTSTEYPKWFYLHWTQHHLEEFIGVAADKATTMGHIQRQHLSSALTVVPPGDTLAQLDVFISPLVEQMIQVRLESRTLAETRDALLPKLLSGEMRVGSL